MEHLSPVVNSEPMNHYTKIGIGRVVAACSSCAILLIVISFHCRPSLVGNTYTAPDGSCITIMDSHTLVWRWADRWGTEDYTIEDGHIKLSRRVALGPGQYLEIVDGGLMGEDEVLYRER